MVAGLVLRMKEVATWDDVGWYERILLLLAFYENIANKRRISKRGGCDSGNSGGCCCSVGNRMANGTLSENHIMWHKYPPSLRGVSSVQYG